MEKEIKILAMRIKSKHRNSDKLEKELNKLFKFIQSTEIFKGKRKKLYKIIKKTKTI